MTEYNWAEHVPGQHEIETYTGKYVDLENPQAHQIDLESIAHGLANTCRYNGQVKFYSVAEHAVMVSRRLERIGFDAYTQLAGLHHDDSEAFLGDVTRPLKSLFQPTYAKLTQAMDLAIVQALKLPFGIMEFDDIRVKMADNWALLVEANRLLPSRGKNWHMSGSAWGVGDLWAATEDVDLWTGGEDPWTAAQSWLDHHCYLMEQLDDIADAQRAVREYVERTTCSECKEPLNTYGPDWCRSHMDQQRGAA